MTAKKIGILGNGHVGSALARGTERAGYEVKAVGSDKKAQQDTARWADLVVLAIPFHAVDEVLGTVGDALDGKTLVDVTNAVTPEMKLAVGFTTSGAEEIQKKAPRARVAKAFNCVFAQHMDTGRVGDQRLTAFVASDDARAKSETLELARNIGFDAVDAGPLESARLLEPLALLNMRLGFMLGMGTQIGIELVHA